MTGGGLSQFSGTAAEEHLSLRKDGHVAAGLADVFDDVRGEQDHAVGGQVDQQVAEADALLGVETGGGFIDDEQLRVVDQRLGDADAALHPARKAFDLAPGGLLQPDHFQHLSRHAGCAFGDHPAL